MRSPDCPSLLATLSLALAAGPLAAQEIIVTSHQPASVKIFDLRLSGDIAPARETSGTATGLMSSLRDRGRPFAAEIFVADFGGDAVRVFPLAADGNVAPEREIAGPSTQLDQPIGIALDPVAGELFVRLYGTAKILVFPAGAAGDVVPSRVLIGAFPDKVAAGSPSTRCAASCFSPSRSMPARSTSSPSAPPALWCRCARSPGHRRGSSNHRR